MHEEPTPIDYILMEIEKAIEYEFFYLAISTALTLPDICGALISEDGSSKPSRYEDWCKDNLKDDFHFLSAKDLRFLRNGVSHTGKFGNEKDQYSRAVFALPNNDGSKFKDSMLNDIYIYSVDDFCLIITKRVREWYDQNKNHTNVQKNIDRMVRYRPDGFLPAIKGFPVIA